MSSIAQTLCLLAPLTPSGSSVLERARLAFGNLEDVGVLDPADVTAPARDPVPVERGIELFGLAVVAELSFNTGGRSLVRCGPV